MPFHILSMDGGGIRSLLSLRLLERIEKERPGFLNEVDLFAGTSAGAINAVILARHDNPADGLQECINLWENPGLSSTNFTNTMGGLAGVNSMSTNDYLIESLTALLGDMTLDDLKRKVVIPSFQLDGIGNGRRSWQPKTFHNLELRGDEDLGRHESIRAVDAAVRSGAAPIMLPTYQGYADGGIFANNPSMAGLTQVLNAFSQARKERNTKAHLPEIILFSVSCGSTEVYLQPDPPNWGWQKWLLDMHHPLVLIEAVYEANSLMVDYECNEVLEERYFRLDPTLQHLISRQSIDTSQVDRLNEEAAEVDLKPALTWVDSIHWMRGVGHSELAAQVLKGTGPTARKKTAAKKSTTRRPTRKTTAKKTTARKSAAGKTSAGTKSTGESRGDKK